MSDHFSSSDEELEELLGILPVAKNENFFEDIVPLYTDEVFKSHFRLSRQLVNHLAARFENSEYFKRQEGDSIKVTPLKFISVFAWFVANQATYRDVADRFNITKSTLFKIIKRVTHYISDMAPEIIKWPTPQEKIEIENHFRNKDFPGVIGAIDGVHFKISKPSIDPDSYLNRKHFFSIQAQVVCDHRRKIRDIFIGYPGSVHDSRVFRNSRLNNTLANDCGEYFIIGDSGYPCTRHLLTPFRDNGFLTRRQRNFNYILSKNRYIVEHCFGIWKQKFRHLYHIKLKNVQEIVHLIRATAVLHNLCLDEDFFEEDEDNHIVVNHINEGNEEGNEEDGVNFRNDIMNNLNFILE